MLLVYANSFPGTFILDDLHIVRNNPLVNDLDLWMIFRSDYWHGIERSGLYRPLTILSLAINRLLFGKQPFGYHLVNVLLHGGVAILLWETMCRWRLPVVACWAAALLFAVHPVHTEVVNEVVGRSELLVALFVLSALLAFDRAGGWFMLLGSSLFLCALLSKEHAVTLVAILPLVEAFREGSWEAWRRRWPVYAGLVSIVVVWLTWRATGIVEVMPKLTVSPDASPLAYVDGLTRILTALQNQGLYFAKLLWPFGLQAVYSSADLPGFVTSLFSLRGGLTVVTSALALAGLCLGWRRRTPLALAGVLYLVAFAPTANLVFSIGVTFAERLAYFPSVWFCAGGGIGVAWLWAEARWRPVVVGIIGVYLLVLAGVCSLRNPAFGSEGRLWQAEVEQNPGDYLGWQSLAESLSNSRRLLEAETAYRRMLELKPDYAGGMRSYAAFLLREKRFRDALQPARAAYLASQVKADGVGMAMDSLDLAEVYLGLADHRAALRALEPGKAFLTGNSRFFELLGRSLHGLGRDQEAVAAFVQVQRTSPDSNIRFLYAMSLLRLSKLDEARKLLEGDVEVRPDAAEAWNLLGAVCAEKQDWPAAVTSFARASRLEPGNRFYRDNERKARTLMTSGSGTESLETITEGGIAPGPRE